MTRDPCFECGKPSSTSEAGKREPCFECGKLLLPGSLRKYYPVPKQRGGTKSVSLCASCFKLAQRDMSMLTRDALAKARKRGVQLGRAPLPADALALRAQEMRTSGMTRQAIADTFNAEGVPTLRDARQWTPSTVRGLLSRNALQGD